MSDDVTLSPAIESILTELLLDAQETRMDWSEFDGRSNLWFIEDIVTRLRTALASDRAALGERIAQSIEDDAPSWQDLRIADRIRRGDYPYPLARSSVDPDTQGGRDE